MATGAEGADDVLMLRAGFAAILAVSVAACSSTSGNGQRLGTGAGGASSSGGAASGAGGRGASGGNAGSSGGGGAGVSGSGGGGTASGGATFDAGADGATLRTSCKRGVAYGFDPTSAPQDLAALSPGVTWYYGWASSPSAAAAPAYQGAGIEFVPMVWGGSFDVNTVVSQIPAGAKYLLGFNEPNFYSQANLTPQQAAALWPSLEQIAQQKNLALVSPALNYCGGGCNVTNPYDWFDQFFAACTGCRVDYLAVHWYACSRSALSGYIDGFRKYGKKIWLTEFACGDQGTQPVSVQQAYMADALDFLENDPIIFRYAWFSGRTTAIANVDLLGSGGTLTALGSDYVSLPALCRP